MSPSNEIVAPAIKMYCLFSRESIDKMGGNRGKMAAQAGHAYLHSYWNNMESCSDTIRETGLRYKSSGMAYKICLLVDTDEQLIELYKKYSFVCGVSLVKDAGKTVFKEPTITCLGIGPLSDAFKGDDLKELKVLI